MENSQTQKIETVKDLRKATLELLANDKIKATISILLKYLDGTHIHIDIVNISARFFYFEEKYTQGKLNTQEFDLSRTQIRTSIIDVVEKLKNEELNIAPHLEKDDKNIQERYMLSIAIVQILLVLKMIPTGCTISELKRKSGNKRGEIGKAVHKELQRYLYVESIISNGITHHRLTPKGWELVKSLENCPLFVTNLNT